MRPSIVKRLQERWPADVVTERDLRLLLSDLTPAARRNQLLRAVAGGDLVHLRRGVYCLPSHHQRRGFHLFELANQMYQPSYVSLEAALAHYQLIPEAVYTTTSVSPRNDATFENQFGIFSYKRMALRTFSEGFERHDEEKRHYLIATPLKALLDLVAVRGRVYQDLRDLEDDLRLDLDAFAQQIISVPNKAIQSYRDLYRGKAVSRVIDLVLWSLL